MLVVAQRLTVRRLALLAEVATAGLGALKRVDRQQFAKLEEVGDAPGVLETQVLRIRRQRRESPMPDLFVEILSSPIAPWPSAPPSGSEK